MATDIDYYETLGVSRSADGAEIKSAYRRLAMQFHPDKNGGCVDSEAKFKAVSQAYECLKDPQKRAAYDRFGHAAFQNAGFGGGRGGGAEFTDISDLFESIFGGGFSAAGQRQRGPARGADLRYDLQINLEDAYHGAKKTFEIDVAVQCATCDGSGAKPGTAINACPHCNGHGKVRTSQGFFAVERVCAGCRGTGRVIEVPCRDCRGEGRADKRQALTVDIPAGVDEGTRIRLAGRGEAGANGAPPGDLYLFIHLAKHAIFQREGTALFAKIPVSFTTAALGGSIEVPGLDGELHAIRIPAGLQSGKQIRQRGAGMPVLNARGKGDMVVEIQVETPTRLSAKQKELLAAFQETETGDECPESKGFFGKIKEIIGER